MARVIFGSFSKLGRRSIMMNGVESLNNLENLKISDVERKFDLITRDLEEVIGSDRIRPILEQRDLSVYWGTATTGKPHIAYFVPLLKICDFLKANCKVTVLFADLHAYLDNTKAPWSLLEHRTNYYRELITTMLKSLNISTEQLKFVRGTDFQLTKDYVLDVYKMCTISTLHDCKKAGSDVVKQVEHPLLSAFIYPGLQALDEEYLDVDAQFGGLDQRKIFTFAEKVLPQLGYKKRIHLMNPMVTGLSGGKMSASEAGSKIDLLDSQDEIKRKIKQSFCEEGNIETNGVLAFCKHIIIPIINQKYGKIEFEVERGEKFGGNIIFNSYRELEKSFSDKLLHPGDLKNAVTKYLDIILSPIREHFNGNKMTELIKLAYPDTVTETKHPFDFDILDIAAGTIKEVLIHPDVPNCFVFKVDVASNKPLTICHFDENKMADAVNQTVIVIKNVVPVKIGSLYSNGILFMIKPFKNNDSKAISDSLQEKKVLAVSKGIETGQKLHFSSFPNTVYKRKQINTNNQIFSHLLENLTISNDNRLELQDGCLMSENDSVTTQISSGVVIFNSLPKE